MCQQHEQGQISHSYAFQLVIEQIHNLVVGYTLAICKMMLMLVLTSLFDKMSITWITVDDFILDMVIGTAAQL